MNLSKLNILLDAERAYKEELKEITVSMDELLKRYRSDTVHKHATELMQNIMIEHVKHRVDKKYEERLREIAHRQLLCESTYLAALAAAVSADDIKTVREYLMSQDAPSFADIVLFDASPCDLSKLFEENKAASGNEVSIKTNSKPHVYVLEFDGDILASEVSRLREEVTAILLHAQPERKDRVIIKLNSSGGTTTGYGLAASQLQRIKDAKIPLVVSIDKVAASGGYMMACVGKLCDCMISMCVRT